MQKKIARQKRKKKAKQLESHKIKVGARQKRKQKYSGAQREESWSTEKLFIKCT
jgi:hypothetical protein